MRIFAITTLLFLAACTTERSRGRGPGGELSIEDFLDAGSKTDLDASLSEDGGRSVKGDASLVTSDTGSDAGPQCVPFDPPPAAGPCREEAWACLIAADGGEIDFDTCFEEYPACDQCIADRFNDRLVGTIADPGPCQQERFCFLGCLIHYCPEDDMRCLEAAVTNECRALAESYNVCGRSRENENTCADFAITNCRPDAT